MGDEPKAEVTVESEDTPVATDVPVAADGGGAIPVDYYALAERFGVREAFWKHRHSQEMAQLDDCFLEPGRKSRTHYSRARLVEAVARFNVEGLRFTGAEGQELMIPPAEPGVELNELLADGRSQVPLNIKAVALEAKRCLAGSFGLDVALDAFELARMEGPRDTAGRNENFYHPPVVAARTNFLKLMARFNVEVLGFTGTPNEELKFPSVPEDRVRKYRDLCEDFESEILSEAQLLL